MRFHPFANTPTQNMCRYFLAISGTEGIDWIMESILANRFAKFDVEQAMHLKSILHWKLFNDR